mmetsp:Transcript_18930/g.48420  ORF Transcript_18930/g.48420 Transcript_18930/m.48420 type:complete len:277 (+) Transcript_18930:1363-2193(+)
MLVGWRHHPRCDNTMELGPCRVCVSAILRELVRLRDDIVEIEGAIELVLLEVVTKGVHLHTTRAIRETLLAVGILRMVLGAPQLDELVVLDGLRGHEAEADLDEEVGRIGTRRQLKAELPEVRDSLVLEAAAAAVDKLALGEKKKLREGLVRREAWLVDRGDHAQARLGKHLENVDDDARVDCVERRSGLIEQQDRRRGHELDADTDAAHLAAGEAADAQVLSEGEVALVLQAKEPKHRLTACSAHVVGLVLIGAQHRRELHVLPDGQLIIEDVLL